MATSASTDFNRTATELVNRAMRHMGVIGQEETPNASELADGLEALNVLVELVQLAMNQSCRIENSMASMDHVIVKGKDHQRRVRYDAFKEAGIHGKEIGGIGMNGPSQLLNCLLARKERNPDET